MKKLITEVNMSPGVLEKFLQSPIVSGIRAGFEAEMCFSGMGAPGDDDDGEPDYDMDENTGDIDGVLDFFDATMSRYERNRLRQSLETEYQEWRSERLGALWSNVEHEVVYEYISTYEWDKDDELRNILEEEYDSEEVEAILANNELPNMEQDADLAEKYSEAESQLDDKLQEKVDQSISSQDSDWDEAYEQWRDHYDGDEVSESEWLSDHYPYMMDIENSFDVTWPHRQQNDTGNEFNEWAADMLAGDLRDHLGVETYVSPSYGGRRPEDTWVFEPDSSIEAKDGDMPVEIISPPMPIQECIDKLYEFLKWASSNRGYTNNSTGLHVGVSLPREGGKVDFLKLAVFLGDTYVLEQFGREANTYCKSTLNAVRRRMLTGTESALTDSKLESALDLMAKRLSEFAGRAIQQRNHDRYLVINMHDEYIEFRSMGGDYIDDYQKIRSTILRYAYAMTIAADPSAERKEYAKKLYKFISSFAANKPDQVLLATLANRASNQLPRSALAAFKRDYIKLLQKQGPAPLPGSAGKDQKDAQAANAPYKPTYTQDPKKPAPQKFPYAVTAPNGKRVAVYAVNPADAVNLAKYHYSELVQFPDNQFQVKFTQSGEGGMGYFSPRGGII